MMQVVIYTSLNVIYDEKGQCVSNVSLTLNCIINP